jgi:xylulokinase
MSVMLSAASCLQWAKHSLGAASESELENQASQLHADDRAAAPLFLPYLGGERTPHNQANLRASFHGIGHGTSQAAMAYAVFEGVTFGLLDGLAALRQGGSEVHRLSLVGGGARSAMWAQQLASALDIEIVTHQESTAGGALGAARLAWMANGGTLADVCVQPTVAQSYQPNASEQAMLRPRYARFKALYAALQTMQSAA